MMKFAKRAVSLLLVLTMVLTICISLFPASAQAASFTGVTGPTLVKRDGVWYYVKNGAVCYDRTLVKYSGSWWFVKDGKVASNLTTLVKYNNEWWYVVNGKVASSTTSLVKYNGEWWYVVKGKIASNTTSLVKYNNEWWYVVKGKIASNTTSLVKYNNEWWYVVKGKIAAKTTTLVKYNGSWYYIVKGKMAGNTTGFVSYNGAKYYVKNGAMQSTLSGKVTVGGGTYFVKNGVLTNCHSAGHSWKAATCTAPKTCTKCLLTEGSALGHNYGLRGIIVEATCTTDGEKDMACTRCWDSYTAVIEAPGHSFENGICTRCGRSVISITDVLSAPMDGLDEIQGFVSGYYAQDCYYKGNFRFIFNSVDGVILSWGATNTSNKTIKYITFTIEYYNAVGDPAYDSITGKSSYTARMTGPIQAGKSFYLRDLIGYGSDIYYGVMTDVKIEYMDGSTLIGNYGYTTWHNIRTSASPRHCYIIED